jgi:hypothetical protein
MGGTFKVFDWRFIKAPAVERANGVCAQYNGNSAGQWWASVLGLWVYLSVGYDSCSISDKLVY